MVRMQTTNIFSDYLCGNLTPVNSTGYNFGGLLQLNQFQNFVTEIPLFLKLLELQSLMKSLLPLCTRHASEITWSTVLAQLPDPRLYTFYQYPNTTLKRKAKHWILNHHMNNSFDYIGVQMFPISQIECNLNGMKSWNWTKHTLVTPKLSSQVTLGSRTVDFKLATSRNWWKEVFLPV